MPIDFSPKRWARVKETYADWWAGKLDRPVVNTVLTGRDPGRPQPKAPLLSQATCADLSIPAEALIDRLDYELSKNVYLDAAFPWLNLDAFGPCVASAFMGARLDNSTGSVWFHPPSDIPIEELHLSYDPDNVWLRRIKEICVAAMRRWQGQVLVGIPDLGGGIDILSTFRPSDKLPMDLVDSPDEVKRLVWEIHELWHRFYAEICAVLDPVNPGYTTWCGIYSDVPYYILQSDFSYMISPDMFDEFVREELEASARRLPRSLYHLDGRGQLPHLDMLLAMERIDGIQWIPGAGAPTCEHWPDVYRRIFAAGKKTQVPLGYDAIVGLVREVGVGPGMHYWPPVMPITEEKMVQRTLTELGVQG